MDEHNKVVMTAELDLITVMISYCPIQDQSVYSTYWVGHLRQRF